MLSMPNGVVLSTINIFGKRLTNCRGVTLKMNECPYDGLICIVNQINTLILNKHIPRSKEKQEHLDHKIWISNINASTSGENY